MGIIYRPRNDNGLEIDKIKAENLTVYVPVSNGVDDTENIQAVIDYASANNKNVVSFKPNQTYFVNAALGDDTTFAYGIQLKSGLIIVIPATTTIKAIANDHQNSAIFKGINVHDIKITGGGSIIGDKDIHTGVAGEWGMGIDFRSSYNIEIDNIKVSKCWGDGLYFSASENDQASVCKNIIVKNVISDSNRRQGMSISGAENVLIEHCVFSNTIGAAPSLGIDLEPDYPVVRNKRILMHDVQFLNNHGSISVAQSDDVVICDSFLGIDATAVYCISGENISLYNCSIEGPIYSVNNFRAYNCDIYKSAATGNNIYNLSDMEGPVDGRQLFFKDCRFFNTGSICFAWLHRVNDEKSRYVFDNCIFILDGNTCYNFASPFNLGATTRVSFINCRYIHQGNNPPNYYDVFGDADGVYHRHISCFADSIFLPSGVAGTYMKNTVL